MGSTSNSAKQRWNASRYTQLKIAAAPELAASFKAKCASEGVSMASEISRFMGAKVGGARTSELPLPSADPYGTRQKRRKAVSKVIMQIKYIKAAEQRYLGNIPINLQGSSLYAAAEETVAALDDALDSLSEAYW